MSMQPDPETRLRAAEAEIERLRSYVGDETFGGIEWWGRTREDAIQEVRDAEARISAIDAIHRPDPRHNGALCEDDNQPWPCRTARTKEDES